MRRKLTEKTSQLADRAYAAKRKMDNVIRVEAHKQILSEMAAIKESLGRQSIRLRRARSEPERDLALEQTAQLVNEIVLRFSSSRNDSDAGTPEVWTPALDSFWPRIDGLTPWVRRNCYRAFLSCNEVRRSVQTFTTESKR